MKKVLQIGNILFFLLVLFVNYISNTGAINGETMASVSAKYSNLFTPAGYAFSIWGVIYLFLLGFVAYQSQGLFGNKEPRPVVQQIGWWFIISCIANITWIFAWLNEALAISILIMILLLVSLIAIILRTRMELDDEPLSVIALLWWPFSFYSGWISVALIANIAAYLTSIGWDGFGISQVTWTLIMIFVAAVVNLVITWRRNMREFALVGAWALIAIAVANGDLNQTIGVTAVLIALILLTSSGIHGFKNREYAPWKKL